MLKKRTENFIEKVSELKTTLIKEVAGSIFDSYTDERELLLYKKVFGLFDEAMELMGEQAETLDDINTKLDLLLEKSES